MSSDRPRALSMEDLRPERLDEVIGQPEVIDRLRSIAAAVRAGRIVPPSLLFHGPPGVGKTTAARAFAREILGQEWENGFNTVSASDDRGLEFFRNRVVPLLDRPAKRGAPFRILFFDEADGLDADVQKALRPSMESAAATTVFILACNDLAGLSEPLRARCVLFEFARVPPEDMERVVSNALAKAHLTLDETERASMVERSHGVPREAIKLLVAEHAGRATSGSS